MTPVRAPFRVAADSIRRTGTAPSPKAAVQEAVGVLTDRERKSVYAAVEVARQRTKPSVDVPAHKRRKLVLPSQLRKDLAFLECIHILNLLDAHPATERDREHARRLVALLKRKCGV